MCLQTNNLRNFLILTIVQFKPNPTMYKYKLGTVDSLYG